MGMTVVRRGGVGGVVGGGGGAGGGGVGSRGACGRGRGGAGGRGGGGGGREGGAALWGWGAGLGWVPVDLGKGGSSAKVGSVDGSEKLVVLATNFWPSSIRVVGAKAPCGPSGQEITFGWWSSAEYQVERK